MTRRPSNDDHQRTRGESRCVVRYSRSCGGLHLGHRQTVLHAAGVDRTLSCYTPSHPNKAGRQSRRPEYVDVCCMQRGLLSGERALNRGCSQLDVYKPVRPDHTHTLGVAPASVHPARGQGARPPCPWKCRLRFSIFPAASFGR